MEEPPISSQPYRLWYELFQFYHLKIKVSRFHKQIQIVIRIPNTIEEVEIEIPPQVFRTTNLFYPK